jgi:replicative DNA helicase
MADTSVNLLNVFTKTWHESVQKRWRGEPDSSVIPTGFVLLDERTGGLRAGQLTLLAARPSMGKTSFALSLARNVAKTCDVNECVIFFSIEMYEGDILNNLVAQEGSVPLEFFYKNLEEPSEKMSVRVKKRYQTDTEKALNALDQLNLFVDCTSALTTPMLKERVRTLAQSFTPKLIMVDYVQLMSSQGHVESRNVQVGEWTKDLKAAAKEFRCPIIALSQLNRSLETEQDNPQRIPDLRHLRDSGSLEQDADNVWFLWRPKYYLGDKCSTEEEDVAYVLVAKARQGARRLKIPTQFVEEFTRFQNLDIERVSVLQRRGSLKY